MSKILRYGLLDMARSKWLAAYMLLLIFISAGLFYASGSAAKSIVSLLNVVLVIVPLVSTVFGSIYFYSRRGFLELLLVQPISRARVFTATYLGFAVPLALAFVFGLLLSFFFYGQEILPELDNALALLVAGAGLTLSFSGLAFLISVVLEDRMKGTAIALLLCLFLSVVYDGVILLAATGFSDYPVEKLSLFLVALNPVSLARVLVLLNLDISALMGYTGTVFHNFWGSTAGMAVALAMLSGWVAAPLITGVLCFQRKDL